MGPAGGRCPAVAQLCVLVQCSGVESWPVTCLSLVIPKTWVRSLVQEDVLEEGMANHSSILAWRIPWPEEPGGL